MGTFSSLKAVLLSALTLCTAIAFAQTPADSVAIVKAKWETRKVTKGIIAKQATFDQLYGGPQEVFIVEVNNKRHTLEALPHNRRELTTEKATREGAVAAINGTYFDIGKTDLSICYVAHKGVVTDSIYDVSPLSDGAFVATGNKVSIVPWTGDRTERPLGDEVMVCGPLMLQKGLVQDFSDYSHIMGKHPRSGIATKKNKTCLIVIDGRAKGRATGVTIPEFAHLLKILGMQDALNLDGGGSSVLWVEPKVKFLNDGSPVCPCTGILNTPSDGHERSVSNSIIVK